MLLLFEITSISVISFCESDQFLADKVPNKKKGKYHIHGLPQNTRTNIIALLLQLLYKKHKQDLQKTRKEPS